MPPTVTQIKWRPPGGVVEIKNVSAFETFDFTSDAKLQSYCRALAEKRYLFVSDVRSWPSPADVMATWQEKGLMSISFLEVAGSRPSGWQVHEMMPGIQQWEIRLLQEMLDNQPLQWTGRKGKL